jgi:hypothetical protein
MLKRKSDSSSQSLKNVRLYRDDVKLIYDELNSACAKVTIETDEFQADAVDDLREYPRHRISGLEVRGQDPFVSVQFRRWGVHLFRYDDTHVAAGVADNIRNILANRQRRPKWLFTWWPYWFLVLICWGAIGVRFIEPLGDAREWISIAISSGAGLMILPLLYVSFKRGSVVFSSNRRDSPSFMRRNADALTVNGLVAVVSIAMTAVLTYYLTR